MSTATIRAFALIPLAALWLLAHAAPALGQCALAPDAFEDNDSCSTAAPITLPFQASLLNVDEFDGDFFAFTVPGASVLVATLTQTSGGTPPVMALYRDAQDCAYLGAGPVTWNEQGHPIVLRWTHTGTGPHDFILAVRFGSPFDCAVYDLEVHTLADPCAQLAPDPYEPNDTCATAMTLSQGVHTGLWCGLEEVDPDQFHVDVPPGHRATVQVRPVTPGLSLRLSNQNTACAWPSSVGGPHLNGLDLNYANYGPTSAVVAFQVHVPRFVAPECGEYELTVVVAPDPCTAVTPDVLEPNGGCSASTPIAPGIYPGLIAHPYSVEQDWYQITVPDGQEVRVDLAFAHAQGDIDVVLDWACIYPVEQAVSTDDDEHVVWANRFGFDRDVRIGVYFKHTEPLGCNVYDMTVRLGPITDPCPHDSFEDNDTCATPARVTDGVYGGLHVSSSDADYYEFEVAPGSLFSAEVVYANPPGHVWADLHTPASACTGAPGDLAFGISLFRGKVAQWVNDTGAVAYPILKVQYFAPNGSCKDYDLIVSGTTTPAPLGATFCTPLRHSLYVYALTFASNSASVAAQDLRLQAMPLPQNSVGYYLYAGTYGAPMAVASGRLCLAAPIYRLSNYVRNSGWTGIADLTLPWGGLPRPILAGETWHFQYWFRDYAGGHTSNFAQGVSLTFTN